LEFFEEGMKGIIVFAVLLIGIACANSDWKSAIFPKIRSTGSVVFTPAKLPCSYSIQMIGKKTIKTTIQQFKKTYFYNGGMLYGSFSTPDSFSEGVYRTDLQKGSGPEAMVPVFDAWHDFMQKKCTQQDAQRKYIDLSIKQNLLYFTQTQTFDSVSDTVFQGKKCKMYHLKDSVQELRLYADEKHYVIGLWVQQGVVETSASVQYVFKYDLKSFAFDRKAFPTCYERAYSTPNDQCK